LAVFTDSSLEERFSLEDICGVLGSHLPRSLGGEAAEPKLKVVGGDSGRGGGGAGGGAKDAKKATVNLSMPGELERVLAATFPRKDKAGLYNGPYFTMGFYLQSSMNGVPTVGHPGGHYGLVAHAASGAKGAGGRGREAGVVSVPGIVPGHAADDIDDTPLGSLPFMPFRPTECVLKVRISPREAEDGQSDAADAANAAQGAVGANGIKSQWAKKTPAGGRSGDAKRLKVAHDASE
jgi:hypothetical protein